MRLKSAVQYGSAIAMLSTSFFVFAETVPATTRATTEDPPVSELLIEADNKVTVPDTPIQKSEKSFNFDWNQYASLAGNQKRASEVETQLKKISNYSKLSKADQEALGKLLYKMGTYYTHIAREPNLAIPKMNAAEPLLLNPEDKAWNYDHLAYAYEQQYTHTRQAADRERALYYSSKVITDMYPKTKNKEVAFAYCVKGLVLNDAQDYAQAEVNLNNALKIYESLPDGKDDQYTRAKNKLADVILEQHGRDKEAIAMLEQIKKYWAMKSKPHTNPYAARNLISLGQAYLKIGAAIEAQNEFKNAIFIYLNVYGEQSKLLVTPYQLLSIAYKKAGNKQLAAAYQAKAKALNKS